MEQREIMTFKEYDDLARILNYQYPRTTTFLHLLEEVGEATKIYSKALRRGKVTLADEEELLYELGDILGCLTQFAGHFGWSLAHLAKHNIKKLKYREELGKDLHE